MKGVFSKFTNNEVSASRQCFSQIPMFQAFYLEFLPSRERALEQLRSVSRGA